MLSCWACLCAWKPQQIFSDISFFTAEPPHPKTNLSPKSAENNNTKFRVDLDFKIFNRYGELVFETNDAEISWDGTYKGKKQEMDVYTYFIKVIYLDKGVVEESGNISLLR